MRETTELLAKFFGAMSKLPVSERGEAYKAAIEAVRSNSIVVEEEPPRAVLPADEEFVARQHDPVFMALVRGVKRRRSAEKKKRKRNYSRSAEEIFQGLEQYIVEVGGNSETSLRGWTVGTQQCGSAYYLGPNNIRARSRVEVARILGLPTSPPNSSAQPNNKKTKKNPAKSTPPSPPQSNQHIVEQEPTPEGRNVPRIPIQREQNYDEQQAPVAPAELTRDFFFAPSGNNNNATSRQTPEQAVAEPTSSVVEHLLMPPPFAESNSTLDVRQPPSVSATHFETRHQHTAPFQLPLAVSSDEITQPTRPPPPPPPPLQA